MDIIKINNVAIPNPSAHELSFSDIASSKSGRNTSGTMIIDLIRTDVRKLSLSWTNITQAEASAILSAISPATFSVKYYDPKTGNAQTFTAYKGDRNISPYMMPSATKSTWIFSSLSVDLIEV